MTYDGAKEFIKPLIIELTGVKSIWDYQNNPKPPNPYISLRLSPERSIGTEVRRKKDASGVLDVIGRKEATLSINSFGTGAIDKCNQLWLSLKRPTIVDRCFIVGIAFTRAEEVQDLTALLDGRSWEERANLDLIVTYSRSMIDEPGYIDTVIVNGELGNIDPVIPDTDPAIADVTITMKGVQ